jgi:hypothetical protein
MIRAAYEMFPSVGRKGPTAFSSFYEQVKPTRLTASSLSGGKATEGCSGTASAIVCGAGWPINIELFEFVSEGQDR